MCVRNFFYLLGCMIPSLQMLSGSVWMQLMNFSKQTLKLIENLAKINPSIYFRKGKVITVKNPAGTILANAFIKDPFPMDFGIYDVHKLVYLLKSLSDPVLEFDSSGNSLEMHSGNKSARLLGGSEEILAYTMGGSVPKRFSDRNKIETVPMCMVSEADLKSIIGTSGTLEFNRIHISADGSKVMLKCFNASTKTEKFCISLDSVTRDKFGMDFDIRNLVMMPGEYALSAVPGKSCVFRSKALGIEYWLMANVDDL